MVQQWMDGRTGMRQEEEYQRGIVFRWSGPRPLAETVVGVLTTYWARARMHLHFGGEVKELSGLSWVAHLLASGVGQSR